jgi:hypothetical protein
MALPSFISSLFHTKAKDWIFGRLQPEQLPPDEAAPAVIPVNQAYVEIVLKSARVVNVRKGLNKFYGAVHSYLSLPLRSGTIGEFNTVTTPSNLQKVDAANLDTVIAVNRVILGPVPYRAAPLVMEIGLFSVKEADLAGPFLKVLEDLSSAAGVGVVQQALPFAAPLTAGINLLSGGAADIALEIGLMTSLSTATEPLQSGWYAVMRAEKTQVDFRNLRLTADDYRLVDTGGKPVSDYPYLVFKVAATPQRDQWFLIKELSDRYEEIRREVEAGRVEGAQEAFAAFKRTAILSHDLLAQDAQRLVEDVRQEMGVALPGGLTSAVRMRSATPLAGGGTPNGMRRFQDIPLYSPRK